MIEHGSKVAITNSHSENYLHNVYSGVQLMMIVFDNYFIITYIVYVLKLIDMIYFRTGSRCCDLPVDLPCLKSLSKIAELSFAF